MNTAWSAASQLVAVGAVAGMCAASPAALGQTSSGALEATAAAAAVRQGDAGRAIRLEQSCRSLRDSRGEKVRARAGGVPATSGGNDCGADSTRATPQALHPSRDTRALTVGSAQADRSGSRDASPIAAHVSAGRLSATLVTGGTAVFLLQSSLWTYLLILGLPLWQHVDLLPIVDAASDDEGATEDPGPDAEEERAITHVLDARNPQRGGPRGRA
jgi:hypothetical protein